MELKTLQYFSHNLTDPIHEVFQVLDNPNHSEYNKLLHVLYLQPIITQYFASNKSEIWP